MTKRFGIRPFLGRTIRKGAADGDSPGGRAWILACFVLLLAALLFLVGAGRSLAAEASSTPPGTPLVYCYQGRLSEPRLVVVDKARQRVMVFRYLGEMQLEYEFPCSTGERLGKKEASGDERTPEGVYFTTHRYRDRKVTIFGDRALHLNYPNACDLSQGRDGDGIYIHGTNRELKPRASNGCVVMRNQDLALVAPLVREQSTPVVVVDNMRLPTLDERIKACNFLDRLKLAKLDQAVTPLDNYLALTDPPEDHAELAGLGRRLAGLPPRITAETSGLALFGAGGQWVLVADQQLNGPKRQKAQVTRRFYFAGNDVEQLGPVRGEWVLSDLKTAQKLAAWAPTTAAPPAMTASSAGSAVSRPAVAPKVPPASPAQREDAQVRAMLNRWLKAWQAKQLDRYIAFYDHGFSSDGKNRKQWRDHKAYLNRVYKVITVGARNLEISVKGDRATVSFTQDYRSDWHRDVGLKKMVLVKRGGHWLILSESWQELPKKARLMTAPSRDA